MQGSVFRPIVLATILCGTLDILLATGLTLMRGREPAAMLRFVASGPFPRATEWGDAGSVLGLIVHFTLMAIMVGVFVIAARNFASLPDRPLVSAIAYGLITYGVMNLLVVPLRFPAAWPPSGLSIGTQLFAHVVLVALPTVLIARHYFRG
jgi:hypothetical protein